MLYSLGGSHRTYQINPSFVRFMVALFINLYSFNMVLYAY